MQNDCSVLWPCPATAPIALGLNSVAAPEKFIKEAPMTIAIYKLREGNENENERPEKSGSALTKKAGKMSCELEYDIPRPMNEGASRPMFIHCPTCVRRKGGYKFG